MKHTVPVTGFLFLVFFVSVGTAADIKETPGYDECVKATGVDISMPPTDTKKMNCFVKCLAEKVGSIDNDGNINTQKFNEFIKKKFPTIADSEINKMNTCLSGVGKVTQCDDMEKLDSCYPKEIKGM